MQDAFVTSGEGTLGSVMPAGTVFDVADDFVFGKAVQELPDDPNKAAAVVTEASTPKELDHIKVLREVALKKRGIQPGALPSQHMTADAVPKKTKSATRRPSVQN